MEFMQLGTSDKYGYLECRNCRYWDLSRKLEMEYRGNDNVFAPCKKGVPELSGGVPFMGADASCPMGSRGFRVSLRHLREFPEMIDEMSKYISSCKKEVFAERAAMRKGRDAYYDTLAQNGFDRKAAEEAEDRAYKAELCRHGIAV